MTPRRLLVLCGLAIPLLVPSSAMAGTNEARVMIFVIHDTSYEELLSIPSVAQVAAAGGEALLANADDLFAQARDLEQDPLVDRTGSAVDVRFVDLGTPPVGTERSLVFVEAGERIGRAFAGNDAGLIVVASVGASQAMRERGDELNGVVVAEAGSLVHPSGATALTSDSTRRVGVVTGTDLRPTLAAFVGATEESLVGQMQNAGEGSIVAGIHERYLSVRRMYVPVSIAAIVAVIAIGAVALVVFSRRTIVSRRTLHIGLWACLAVPALAVAMLVAGHLPRPSYPAVALILVAVALVLPLLALAFRRKGVLVTPAVFGIIIFGFFVIEAGTGWYGTMFTMLGGTALDGARFYGLPNAFEGLLVGSAVYVAAGLTAGSGYVWIVLTALFIGSPGLGADIGGAVVTLAAAGLWFALRSRGRMDGRGAAVVAATVVVGMGVILLAHRFSAGAPTHGTAFVEASGGDPATVLSTLWERLGIGVRLLRRNPLGLTYLAATPLLLWLVVRRRGGFRESFGEFPHWRTAMLTILWSSVIAYFANDTGVSAVGMGFAMALGGLLYVPLAREAVKMDPR